MLTNCGKQARWRDTKNLLAPSMDGIRYNLLLPL